TTNRDAVTAVFNDGYSFSHWSINYAPMISASNYTGLMYSNRTSYEFLTDETLGSYIRVNGYQSTSSIDTAFWIRNSSAIKVTAGKTYRFSFYVRADKANDAQFINAGSHSTDYCASVFWSNGTKTDASRIDFTNDGNWKYISFDVTVPSGVTTATLSIGNDTPNLCGLDF
ncbi:carbohydrate binding domain-containing protein, partial [Enterococcus faecalis]|uniref:carbohydrate binding domain-containing protein n=1 Tax=Enterococcus faecalis TaxID=1351 RepID=UPI001AD7E249